MPDLTTLANVKSWISVTGASDDALLTRLITATSAAVEQYCERTFASAAQTVTRNGNDKSVMPFPNAPVTAVASVTVDGTAIPARPSVTGSGFSFDEQYLYLAGYRFTRGMQNVVLAFTSGFSATPGDLEQAVIDVVAFKYRGRERIGQASKILQNETVTFLRDVPPDVMRVLDNYRRVVPAA